MRDTFSEDCVLASLISMEGPSDKACTEKGRTEGSSKSDDTGSILSFLAGENGAEPARRLYLVPSLEAEIVGRRSGPRELPADEVVTSLTRPPLSQPEKSPWLPERLVYAVGVVAITLGLLAASYLVGFSQGQGQGATPTESVSILQTAGIVPLSGAACATSSSAP